MPLIPTNSPLYLRRLVRKLNAQVNGFYAPVAAHCTVRCNRARLKAGELQVRSPSTQEWFAPRHHFTDPYGQEIVASREPDRRVA